MNTWLLAIAGGALIGLASGGLMLGLGRIAGISSVIGGVVVRAQGDWGWRLAFVVGLVAAGAIAVQAGVWTPGATQQSVGLIVIAGLLVGIGTALANGCTSGHGVCGLALISTRSLVAVVSFLGTGMVVTYAMRHLMGVH